MKNKTTLITHEEVIADMKKLEENIKKYPIKYFLKDLYYSIIRFLDDMPSNIIAFFQRGKRGYGNKDTWYLNYYLSKLIESSIECFKKESYSHPIDMTEGQWIDTLNTIAYTFELAKRCSGDDNGLLLIRDKKQRIKYDKTFSKINKKFNVNDRCMTSKEIRDYDLGWKLFKTHFFSLWD